jgi:hypothetical protein
MGAFLLGLIAGVAVTLFVFMYDEGAIFLKLASRVREVMARYRQQRVN